MRTVRSLLSDRRKKRFRKRTFLGLTPVTRANTIWGKSPALYLEVYILALFNHMSFFVTICSNLSPPVTISHYLPLFVTICANLWQSVTIRSNLSLCVTIFVTIGHYQPSATIFHQTEFIEKNFKPITKVLHSDRHSPWVTERTRPGGAKRGMRL